MNGIEKNQAFSLKTSQILIIFVMYVKRMFMTEPSIEGTVIDAESYSIITEYGSITELELKTTRSLLSLL
jgi:hypothetical protein